MPSEKRLHSLRKKLAKIAGGETALDTLVPKLQSVRDMSAGSGHESVDVVRPVDTLEKLRDGDFLDITGREFMQLEAVVERDNRQVAFVTGQTFENLPEPWGRYNADPIRSVLNQAIPSIGRVERWSPSGRRTDHIGTGFIVGPKLMMTNRHVAEVFVQGAGNQKLSYVSGTGAFDFGRHKGYKATDIANTLHITGVKMVHPFWDMALLELAELPGDVQPLKLSVTPLDKLQGRLIATIGYPGRGRDTSAVALELEKKFFGDTFNVKRLAPGEIEGVEETLSFRHMVQALVHDSSTLAGNSGSAVLDVESGEVVGLHFKGITLEANFSVPLFDLARDQRVADLGLSFVGSAPRIQDWESWWANPGTESSVLSRERCRTVVPGAIWGGNSGAVGLPAASDIPATRGAGGAAAACSFTVPLHVTLSFGPGGGATGATLDAGAVVEDVGGEEAFQIPIMFGGLEKRKGYDPDFLELGGGELVPLPTLTAKGEKVVARTEDGGAELKYHHFSVVMHKWRRLALFTAANVDWRLAKRLVNGKKATRELLTGIPKNKGIMEQWVMDDRIPEDEQLPDVFFTRDKQAFDKGHLTRRDDVVWGGNLKDMQKANGDTYFTTNCSPQVKEFNQAGYGEDNWGDLEDMVEDHTQAEKVMVFSGPVLSKEDLYFVGLDESGPVKVQIPRLFWKIIVARTDKGVQAFGFLPEQDLTEVPLEEGEEFAMPEDWLPYQVSIEEIEENLFGLATLEWFRKHDAYKKS